MACSWFHSSRATVCEQRGRSLVQLPEKAASRLDIHDISDEGAGRSV